MNELLALVGPKVLKKLGPKIVADLLKGTLGKNGEVTEASMELLKKLNDGEVTDKSAAKKLSKAQRAAQQRLNESSYSRDAWTKVWQDALVPMAAGGARTLGLGYYLYQQILPMVLAEAARQQEQKIPDQWKSGLSMQSNPMALAATVAQGTADFKGKTAMAGANEMGNVLDTLAATAREDSKGEMLRQYLRDHELAEGERPTGAQYDAWSHTAPGATRTAVGGLR